MGPVVEFNSVAELFENITSHYATERRPALMHKVEGTYRGISYARLRSLVEDFSCGLAALGAAKGDRVALLSENRPEWVVADMGLIRLGCVNVAPYPMFTAKQVHFMLRDSEVRFAIVSNQLQLNKVLKIKDDLPSLERIIVIAAGARWDDPRVISYNDVLALGEEHRRRAPEALRDAIRRIAPEDLLTIIYTSGTTGTPKGVMLTHRNLVSNIRDSASCIPFTQADLILSFLPLCHSYERMAGYYTAMACGVTIAYAESIEAVPDNLLEVRPTVVTTVPRLFERMYARALKQVGEGPSARRMVFGWAERIGRRWTRSLRTDDASWLLRIQHGIADRLVFRRIRERTGGRIRFFVSGGAALAPALGEFFEAAGLHIIEGYGMTESSPVISVNRVDDFKFGTVGKPIPHVEIAIASDGEILVRGPNVMQGYWRDPEATREIIDPKGWLRTGDIGMIDPDGFLVITDRKKNMFVSSGGKNIAPQHIENLFLQSRVIDQFVLIGDGRRYLTALIVPKFDVIGEYARTRGIGFADHGDLVRRGEIRDLIGAELTQIQKDLATYERVRRFTLLSQPLTVENGEITPLQKVRRKVVEEKFRSAIDEMYAGLD